MPRGNDAFDTAARIVRALRDAGHEAFLVGGCVRDRLRGQEPREFDVATSARPEQVEALFPATVPVGRAFGVIIVREDDRNTEVATFRRDAAYADGRHPTSVEFSSLEEDARRRDFTVNALYLDPDTGRVIDCVGGRDDIARRVLRTVGDPRARFSEDKLRMMRAVRFHAQLGFEIDADTVHAIRELAPQLSQVSMERIRMELEKILLSPRPSEGIAMLADTGLLPTFLPEVMRMKGVPQPPEFHPEGDVYVHTLLALKHMKAPDFALAMGVLLHDVGKPATIEHADRIRFNQHERVGAETAERIMRRLKCSVEEIDKTRWLVARHLGLMNVSQMRKSTFKRLLAEPHFEDLLKLVYADTMGAHQDLGLLKETEQRRAEIAAEPVKPEPLVRGKDLIEMGLTPGPKFGELLEEAYDLQLDGKLTTREEAMVFLKERLAAGG